MGGRSASVQRAVADENEANRETTKKRESKKKREARAEKETMVDIIGFRSVREAKAMARKFHRGEYDKDKADSAEEARKKAKARKMVKRIPKHYYSAYNNLKTTTKARDKNGKASTPKKRAAGAKKQSAETRKKSARPAKKKSARPARSKAPARTRAKPKAPTGERPAAEPPVKHGEKGFGTTHKIQMRQENGPTLMFRTDADAAAYNQRNR